MTRELKHKAFIGQSGSGKSTLMTKKVKLEAKDYNLVIILNTQGEEFISRISPFKASTIAQLENHIDQQRRIIIFEFSDDIPEEEADNEFYDWELFRELANYIWKIKRYPENKDKKFLFVIDEADNFQTANRIMGIYRKILTKGRKWNLEVWNITQRPAFLNKATFTQSKELFMFELSEYDYGVMRKTGFDYTNPELYEFVIIKN